MHVQVLGFGYATGASRAVRPGLWRRFVARVRTVGATYELDDHLAQDIGARRYTVPFFPAAQHGAWR